MQRDSSNGHVDHTRRQHHLGTREPAPKNGDFVEMIRASKFFDEQWYLSNNPDVAETNADAATHYLAFGGFEKRDPGPLFSNDFYLRANPDVRRANLNPLLHYLLHGVHEGRSYSDTHERWIRETEPLDDVDRAAIRQHIGGLPRHPLISVIVPVHNTDRRHLSEMIESVAKQSYPHWELCIADDHSTQPHVAEILREAAAVEQRIKLSFRDENGHICAATNTALTSATGEFVCLLDHDDMLHENALYEVAVELNAHPEADLIFSDSDHMDDDGLRSTPYFKTDWNYDLMLGHNVVSHLGAYRRTLVEQLGGLRLGYEGSQDYDLALRVADLSKPERIRHIPAILYHWRRSFETATFSDEAQQKCVDAARLAIQDHLARRSIAARVEQAPYAPNFSRVRYSLPPRPPLVTVCIFVDEADEDFVQCVSDVLLRTAYEAIEVLVVHAGQESAPSAAILKRIENDQRVRVLHLADSASLVNAKNHAVEQARGEVVVLLSSDLRISDTDWLNVLVSHAVRPDVGFVGSLIVNTEGKILDAGIVLNAATSEGPSVNRYRGYFSIFALTREVSAVTSAAVAFRRSVYRESGGMEERSSMRQSETALCLRARQAGYRNILTPDAELIRVHNAETDDVCAPPEENQGSDLEHASEDPFYSPNLSLKTLFAEPSSPSRRVKPWAAVRRRLWIRQGQAERAQNMLAGVDRSARILEVGPSYSPIAPRADGWQTTIVDHASRSDLVAKYQNEPDVWIDRIEEVDFIWTDGSIADAVTTELHGTFDVVVASHVIEHVPDLIAFLSATAALLRETGRVILAVPDKRYCFDYFRPLATTAQALEAHEAKRTRHSRRTAFEQWAYTVRNDGQGAWTQEQVGQLSFMTEFATVASSVAALRTDPEAPYVDMHAWQFTPSSFQLILLELARLNHLDWLVESCTPAAGCEFRVRLQRGGIQAAQALSAEAFDARRLDLLNNIVREMAEQAQYAAPTP